METKKGQAASSSYTNDPEMLKIEVPVVFNPNPQVENTLNPFGSGLNDHQIITALLHHAKNKAFLDSNKIGQLKIVNVEYTFVHVYELLVWQQTRTLKNMQRAYDQGRLDDETMGFIPEMWDIETNTNPPEFCKNKEKVKVPHSESVELHKTCDGKGKVQETETIRNSDGSTSTETKWVTCLYCGGTGHVINYLQLKAKWKVEFFEHTTNSIIPNKLLKNAKGTVIFNNSDVTVLPVNYLSNQEISEASKNFIEKLKLLPCEKFLQQRQTIRVIPVALCHYLHGKNPKTFCIYDSDLKVYAPGFPKKVGCLLM